MTWFFAVLLVGVIGAVAVVFAHGGGGMRPVATDRHDLGVPPEGPLSGAQLRQVRLNTAVRGYRADEVDALLERLADQLDQADPPARRDQADPPGQA